MSKLAPVCAAVLALATAAAAHAAPTWITVGERAYALLQPLAPQAQLLSSAQVSVTLPVQRGSSRQLRQGSETVYAVALDDAVLPALSEAVHSQLRRCGGFMQHASMAEALAVLHRAADTAATTQPTPRYVIDNQAVVNSMINQPQASNILATIQGLSDFQNRRYNSSHGANASNWLFAQWQALRPQFRRDVQVRQITHSGWGQKSVVMDFLGTGNSAEVIVIGGHLDSTASGNAETVRAPGADDDASGIASLTEVIRVLVANNYTPKRTIRFIGYAAEEAGLLGSRDIAIAAGADRARVVGVMQLDMTAYQGDATDLWIYTDYTNAAQNQFIADLAAAYLPNLTVSYDACGYACSDHASWHNRGYVASFPFESSDANYNPRIHTANDTIANFGGTANHALKFSKLALAYALELGSDGP